MYFCLSTICIKVILNTLLHLLKQHTCQVVVYDRKHYRQVTKTDWSPLSTSTSAIHSSILIIEDSWIFNA